MSEAGGTRPPPFSNADQRFARLIAFYLPQYHPIPENDAWWGRGFTEWTSVVRARPRFRGHEQPHLPADLGFYDLRLPEARAAQAELARQHGIFGFCYYHYWFNGRRLLERPFQEVLDSHEPDFPFALCWANENWTRAWDGTERDLLLRQQYSPEDDHAHLRWLSVAFADKRYIRVDGKPLFLVYRASNLPEPRRTTDIWRAEAARLGVGELFLCHVESSWLDQVQPIARGFDAAVEFAPDWRELGPLLARDREARWRRRLNLSSPYLDNNVYSYQTLAARMLAKPQPDYLRFPCVTPSWDNSARRNTGATILIDSTPENYRQWLSTVLRRIGHKPAEHHVCFINAWNEWAEGNHLEPCQRWGRAYLEATRSVLEGTM
jgi:lipopolysaccharide biosynthesis protein